MDTTALLCGSYLTASCSPTLQDAQLPTWPGSLESILTGCLYGFCIVWEEWAGMLNLCLPPCHKKRLKRCVSIIALPDILAALLQEPERLWCKEESCLQFVEVSYRFTWSLWNFKQKKSWMMKKYPAAFHSLKKKIKKKVRMKTANSFAHAVVFQKGF